MTKFRTALIVAALLAASTPSFAQGTPEQRSACTGAGSVPAPTSHRRPSVP